MNLQPLKIPAGWTVEWNLLTDTDPTEDTIHEFTGSSLLLISSHTRLKAIDVSWQPEGDINGAYQLQVICLLPKFNTKTNTLDYEGVWEAPELEFSTQNRLELVDKLNHLLFYLKPYTDTRILLQPGVVDKPNEAIRQELLTNDLTEELVEKIMASNHKKLQELLLAHKAVSYADVEKLSQEGATKGVKNKAKQLLNSKQFRNQKSEASSDVDKAKLISLITNKMEAVLVELQQLKPEKEFTLKTYEPNGYWSIHWKSTKLWKTEHYLKEWFTVSLYGNSDAFSLSGSHNIKDVFEQLEEGHFLYKGKTIKTLFKMLDTIEKQTKDAVLKAIDQQFDPSF
ncbi:hypothetical protein DMZ43_07375 [Meridianimaribacter sp. CL38]|uniref:hypothetical protein n=1 Tax=Meridianimaribacter sp. CL38 TaxID=2213021 RepID=UPI00103E181F|nr:hypothetical protein [Meridianimaribacter sp. CL38]TBV26875.1 hypothetical protein DMZ43_07375 [Meridianimaribacter sp. CL38]